MSADFGSTVIGVLRIVLRALGGEPEAPAATLPAALSTDHLGSLGALLRLLPIADLVEIAHGGATWDNTLDAAERMADLVRIAFPPAAITAVEVKLGLEALRFVLDLAGVGPSPIHIEPGQNPIRGGWSGARGHV